ncbi:lipopolysaccharide biosynthesis protein [Oenococcus sp.]|uniref:lipopolysaccharide biosynthesis protein n=1 Tax=Oenococcus sp. TaxID=1979414 RepID=UPI0039EC51EC
MAEPNRLKYSLLNSSVASLTQLATIVIKFIVQTVFIHELGLRYLGANGLFNNILMLLSFSELGLGSAIAFSMYRPLALGKQSEIRALLALYRKAYFYIALIVGLLGLAVLPFLHLLIRHNSLPNIRIYFCLFLANTVISYLFAYKRAILTADQKDYVNLTNQFIFASVQSVLQIIILLIWQNYFLFLIIQIICTLISNVTISRLVDRRYNYLEQLSNSTLPKKDLDTIVQNTIGLIGSQIGGIVVFGTDNLLISSFLGLLSVGLFANYTLVVNALTGILNKAVGAVTASLGNLTISESKSHVFQIFQRYIFINFTLTFFSSSLLASCLNPFIRVWIGQRYLLSELTVLIIIANFAINQMRQPLINFVAAYGLYSRIGWKSMIEALFNLLLSLFFIAVMRWGIAGTLLGTILSNLLINSWWEPSLVLKYGIQEKSLKYWWDYIGYMVVLTISVVLNFYMSETFIWRGFGGLLLTAFVSFVMDLVIFLLLFGRKKEFAFLWGLIRRPFARFRKTA